MDEIDRCCTPTPLRWWEKIYDKLYDLFDWIGDKAEDLFDWIFVD